MGPLSGLKIVELAGIGAGPHCAMMLADLGAEVVRVDRPIASGLGVPIDPKFDLILRGRRSLAIDLKAEAGRNTVLHMIDQADAVIESFRPGVVERMGLGPDICLKRNPKLVYARGGGRMGPTRRWRDTTSTISLCQACSMRLVRQTDLRCRRSTL